MFKNNSILFMCNTYMQLIVAVQMKMKLLQGTSVDLILSDHSQNAETVVEGLKRTGLFRRVKLVNTKYYTFNQNVLEDIKDILTYILGSEKKYRSLIWDEDIVYNAIFYYNLDILIHVIYDISKKNGIEPKCIRYEEGIVSYSAMKKVDVGNRIKLLRIIRALSLKKDIFKNTKDFYCFYPELFQPEEGENCHQIPMIEKNDRELIEVLDSIFGYYAVNHTKKYIYFSTSMDIDGKNVEEDQIVKKIVELVGKDNIVIKLHPRDTRKIYHDMGLTVWEKSEIPWEIIQLNNDFSDKVFISLSSSSILNASAMFNENIRTFYLFPYIKGKNHSFDEYCKKMESCVNNLKRMGYCKNHMIISHISDLV